MGGATEDQLAPRLPEFDPQWMKDGLGVRGRPSTVTSFGAPVEFPHSTIAQTVPASNEPPVGQDSIGQPGGNATAAMPTVPFTPLLNNFGSGYVVGIYANSLLIQSADPNDTFTVSGILSTAFNPPSSDHWFNTSTTDFGFVEIAFDTSNFPTINSATFKNTATGGTFGRPLEYVDTTGMGNYVQSFARIPIYTMGSDPNGNPYVRLWWMAGNISLVDSWEQMLDNTGANPRTIFGKWRTP